MDAAHPPTAATRLRAYVRPASSPDAQPRAYATPNGGLSQAPDISDAKLHPALAAYLQAMSDKLDMLVAYLTQARLDTEYAAAEVLEIGSEGLSLAKAGDLASSRFLEVVVILSQFPLSLVAAVGEVKGEGRRQGEPVRLLSFTSIREEDLERIVQYVFKEERARIRRTKWGE